MVGHDDVDHVFRAPLGHVAAGAIARCGVLLGGDPGLELTGMTRATRLVVVLNCGIAARDVVRIVARRAAEFAALNEASRLTQPVSRSGDFKLVIVPSARGMIEM